jgi:outer membrane protein assembly factor BamB
MLDANSGEMLWQFDVSGDKANIEYSSVSPDGNTLYILMRRKKRVDFFALNLQNGERLWLQEFKLKKEDDASLVATNYGAAVVSVKRVRMFNLATGEEMWEHKYKGDYPGYFMESKGGELLLFSDGDIESLDPTSGDDIWDAKGGYILKLFDDKMLASYKSKGCVMIDLKTGDRIWKSKVFVQDVIVDAHGIGLVYREIDGDDIQMNILNLENGEPVWDEPIENPNAEMVTEDGKMLIYSDEQILEFDPSNGQYTAFMSAIEFEHKEEPTKIEPFGDNLLVSSSQNMMMVTKGGEILYQIDYKPAPQSVGKSILGGAMAVTAIAAAAVSAGAAMQQSANAGYARGSGDFIAADRYQSRADGATDMAAGFAGLAMDGINYATKKFKKTKSSANYTFMLTKESGDIKIVKLKKASGEKEKELIFKDREPVYLYDNEREVLYYRTDKSIMGCFKF